MRSKGFTLLEVLVALMILAIALTALMKASGQAVINSQRLQQKNIQHWVARQGISMIQLGLLPINPNQSVSQVTQMMGQRCYWVAELKPTSIEHLQQIKITLSPSATGPFGDPWYGYRYSP